MQSLSAGLTPEMICSKIREVVGRSRPSVGLHEPSFEGREWEFVKECLDTGWVSSVGKFVDRFERSLSDFTGAPYVVAVVNGTSALHMALKVSGVAAKDEVLVPSLSFVAPANAITYLNAVPHFVDCEKTSLGVDAAKLKAYLEKNAELRRDECFNKATGRRIKALIAVHIFGHPGDLDAIKSVTDAFGITLIEDAAEALGSFYRNRHIGLWGRVSCLSFNGNKTITTGGGGALLTQDEELHRKIRHLSTTAKQPHAWEFYHDESGYNYRLPNLNAALGCAQMERLPDFLVKKRVLQERYERAFHDVPGVKVMREPANARSNYWLNALMFDKSNLSLRDEILNKCHADGILARPVWNLLHTLPMFKLCPRMDLSAAEGIQPRVINLPSSAFL